MMLACILGLIVCNAVPGTVLHSFFLHYMHITLLVSRSEYPKDKPFLLKEFLVRNFVIDLQGHVTYYNLP